MARVSITVRQQPPLAVTSIREGLPYRMIVPSESCSISTS